MDEPLRDDEEPMPAFGMWRDREDMADVEAHVRELRKGRQLVGDADVLNWPDRRR